MGCVLSCGHSRLLADNHHYEDERAVRLGGANGKLAASVQQERRSPSSCADARGEPVGRSVEQVPDVGTLAKKSDKCAGLSAGGPCEINQTLCGEAVSMSGATSAEGALAELGQSALVCCGPRGGGGASENDRKCAADPSRALDCAGHTNDRSNIEGENLRKRKHEGKFSSRQQAKRNKQNGKSAEGQKQQVEPQRHRGTNLAAFISMLLRGHRHSHARIEAARESPGQRHEEPNQARTMGHPDESARARSEEQVEVKILNGPSGTPLASSSSEGGPGNCDKPTTGTTTTRPELMGEPDEVILFTSLQQLCYEIVNRKLVRAGREGERAASDRFLCLFVFGRPGSSRGELAFELVEHSPLVEFIARAEANHDERLGASEPLAAESAGSPPVTATECPLFHYLDICALIVANIDERIREYNRLVAQTLRSRREQLLLGTAGGNNCSNEQDSFESQNSNSNSNSATGTSTTTTPTRAHEEDSGVGPQAADQGQPISRDPSVSSSLSAAGDQHLAAGDSETGGATRTTRKHQAGPHLPTGDQFGLVTLSTKQRSILQLKMIKYACCVTAKWVVGLIQREVLALEQRLARASCTSKKLEPPARVYLVNLVPNQLSLFKTCLYLQQSLPLGQLQVPHWAVKFERRTNIMLMSKERRVSPAAVGTPKEFEAKLQDQQRSCSSAQTGGGGGKRVLVQFKRLSQIKLPHLLGPAAIAAPATDLVALRPSEGPQQADQPAKDCPAAANSLLLSTSSELNEKLGPKFNELFCQQFAQLDKLTRLRYNPTRNYNYSDHNHHLSPVFGDSAPTVEWPPGGGDGPGCDATRATAGRRRSSSSSSSCYQKLSHLIDFEPASPSSASLVSSRASPGASSPLPGDPLGRLVAPASPSGDSHSTTSPAEGHPGEHSHNFRFPQGHQQQPKWAVELELVDAAEEKLAHSPQEASPGRWYSRAAGTPLAVGLSAEGLVVPAHELPTGLALALPTDCCLHVYQRGRQGAPPAAKGSAPHHNSHHASEHYHLVSTRVAYANGKSQPVLEVKRLHKRVFRCSGSRSDLAKLKKLIAKAGACLAEDLDSWLREAITEHTTSHAAAAATANNHLHHPQQHHHQGRAVALVTYTIRVDASRMVGNSLGGPALAERDQNRSPNREERPVPRLTFSGSTSVDEARPAPSASNELAIARLLQMQPSRSNLIKRARPASAAERDPRLSPTHLQAASSSHLGSRLSLQPTTGQQQQQQGGDLGNSLERPSSTTSSQKSSASGRRRRVQFKLAQAPLGPRNHLTQQNEQHNALAHDSDWSGGAQRRLWLRDSLFASSPGEWRLLEAMEALVAGLKSVLGEP